MALFGKCLTDSVIKNLNCTNITVDGNGINRSGYSTYVAVLVGENASGCDINNCNINGTVTHESKDVGEGLAYVGIIAGANHGIVENCASSGSVSASAKTYVVNGEVKIGGVVGYQTGGGGNETIGRVINCTSTATLTNLASDSNEDCVVGGITGRVVSSGAGLNEVNNCHFNGTINFASTLATKRLFVGGIVGDNCSTVTGSSAKGNITVSQFGGTGGYNIYVGGIAGNQSQSGMTMLIENCFADCNIEANYTSNGFVGGAFGYINKGTSSTIRNCYAKGSLYDIREDSTILNFPYGGGFAGDIAGGTVASCYAATAPFSAKTGNTHIKGFFGYGAGSPSDCFWDINTSSVTATNSPATGKTTIQMKTQSTFTDAGYDFATIWAICEGTNYPRLRWQIPAADWVCPDGVDIEDLRYFVDQWLESDCASFNNFCGGADMNTSGVVDFKDFAMFAENWLEGITP